MNFFVGNEYIYGLDRAVKASGNPMRTKLDVSESNEKDFLRAAKLGGCHNGEGHDNFLKGITLHVDVIAPLYWWKEAQRYHWFDFVSSQSTMHRLMKFDVSTQCVDETDPIVIKRVQELIAIYNEIPEGPEHDDERKAQWRIVVASLPEGFCLGATMVTNYQQLKTMYVQRRKHKLKEWHVFCDWCEKLPHFLELTAADQYVK